MRKGSLIISVILIIAGIILCYICYSKCPDSSDYYKVPQYCTPYVYYPENATCCYIQYQTKNKKCISQADCQTWAQQRCKHQKDFNTFQAAFIMLFTIGGFKLLFWLFQVLRECYIQLKANSRILYLQRIGREQIIQDPIIRMNNGDLLQNIIIRPNSIEQVLDLDPEQACSICLQKFIIRIDRIKARSCGHKFHRNCIEKWQARNRTCPYCRRIQ